MPLSGSIIIPVLNEGQNIGTQLRRLRALLNARWELIVVDGGSTDETVSQARDVCDQVLTSSPGRSIQMNAGARAANAELLIFLHADTQLPLAFEAEMQRFRQSASVWGRFDVELTGEGSLFRLIAWMMNQRSRWTGIATGDQTFFVKRQCFDQLQGFCEIPLMEDIDFSRRAAI